MKRFLLKLLVFLLVVGALGLALTPTAVNQYRIWLDAQAVSEYRNAVNALDTLECGTLLAQARRYNEALSGIDLRDVFTGAEAPETDEAYLALLNPAGDGAMAVLEIPKLGLTLPVYHGCSDAALDGGAGHLEGTSLPVGGEGTQCVLAGRRGGRRSGWFANLDRLIPGDCFYIRALQDTLIYEVDQVWTAEPEALKWLLKDGNADTCTLMTGTPYGVENQRLLVRGRRIGRREAPLEDDTRAVPAWATRLVFAAPVVAAGLIVLVVVEALRRGARRRRLRRMKL